VKLYLVRHARPVDVTEDPTKPLSSRGRNEAEEMAGLLAERGSVAPGLIIHSGKKRTLETAEILASRLIPKEGLEERGGLSPNDDPGLWAPVLARLSTDLMIVGHMPFMGKLVWMLSGGQTGGWNCEFVTAETACLERTGDGGWNFLWKASPSTTG
jgi:phosphohistidine phosphatase